MSRSYRIAVIPGDGIGVEVVPEGLRVLRRTAELYGFTVETEQSDTYLGLGNKNAVI